MTVQQTGVTLAYPQFPDEKPDIRLIALDLDDTLLTSGLTITPRTKSAIQASRDQGVAVTFATGRMFLSALPYAIELRLDLPLITYLGALISTSDGRLLSHLTIDKQTCIDILEYLKPLGCNVNVYIEDSFYVEKLTPQVEAYRKAIGAKCLEVPSLVSMMGGYEDGATKIGIMTDKEHSPGLYAGLVERFGDRVTVIPSKPTFIELSRPDTSKGLALAALATELGIVPEQIMAFGDSPNDTDMIEYAGWGIVMANGSEELKGKARWITAGNDDEGVAIAIEQLVLR